MQLMQKLREFFSIGRIYTKHSKKSETFLLLMEYPALYICELLLVCLTCQWSGYFLCPPKILENLALTHACSILTPLVSITNQMLNTGASQLPEEAAIQVNVFGEALFGVLLRDINGIEVPGSVPVVFCIYPLFFFGETFLGCIGEGFLEAFFVQVDVLSMKIIRCG